MNTKKELKDFIFSKASTFRNFRKYGDDYQNTKKIEMDNCASAYIFADEESEQDFIIDKWSKILNMSKVKLRTYCINKEKEFNKNKVKNLLI